MNRVYLKGEVANDPETRNTDSSEVTNFRLLTQSTRNGRTYKEWHNIAAWGQMSEQLRGLEKGDMVFVSGELRTRSWESRDGGKRYTTEVQVFEALAQSQLTHSREQDGGGFSDDDIPY